MKIGEEDVVTSLQLTDEYREAVDIFPALHLYKVDHSDANLTNLCIQVAEFCKAIYASTRNPHEREIYSRVLDNVIMRG